VSQFNQARIEWAIRLKYSPMPKLDMDYLATLNNSFRIGDIRTVGKVWEFMMESDGELAVNEDKRACDAAGQEWKIVSDGSRDGDKHAAALQYFYDHLKATEALEQDDCGKTDHLIYQMISAHSFRYSIHEMLLRIDNPAAKEVTAEFRHTPVWFFECRRGYLGYLKHIFDLYGIPCVEGEWLTVVGKGWMRALSFAYAMKHFPLRDWLLFCCRYGTGVLEGITEAQKDSPEWQQAEELLATIANDAVGLHNRGIELKFLDQPAKNQLPFQPLIEMVNGLYAKCYRGVDLATGSRGATSSGSASAKNPVGASVQSEESGLYLARDCKWLTGYANQRIDAPIIRYLFNQEPRAAFVLMPPLNDDTTEDLASFDSLWPKGFRFGLAELSNRFRWKYAGPDEPCLPPPAPQPAPGNNGNGKNGNGNGKPAASPAAPARQPAPAIPKSGPQPEAERDTIPARPAAAIAPGADPNKAFQTADQGMPDTQVDAAGFWSRAGLAPKGADGQTLPMPSLGYALPQEAGAREGREEEKELAAAVAHDMQPLIERLAAISKIKDDAIFEQKLRALQADFAQLEKDIQADPKAQAVFQQIIMQGFLRGIEGGRAKEAKEEKAKT
jgi:hypothetical protein